MRNTSFYGVNLVAGKTKKFVKIERKMDLPKYQSILF